MGAPPSARKEKELITQPVKLNNGNILYPDGKLTDANGNVLQEGTGASGGPKFGSPQINPNAGIGYNSFGYTPREIEAQRQRAAALGVDYDKLSSERAALQQELDKFNAEWSASNPDPGSMANPGGTAGGVNVLNSLNARLNDPRMQELIARSEALSGQEAAIYGNSDMSDPGRFAAMADGAQGRNGINLTRYDAGRTAAPEIYDMQRQNAPRQWDPGEAQRAQSYSAQTQSVDKTQIDPNAGNADYEAYKQARAKNLEVMGAVGDRAMGRGGPSPAELQMKQGQDRAIAQQAALAASGGQMDSAMARRQAMLGAANIGQKTASDTALLRANEQIAAQNTYGGMNSTQQSADLSARNQSFGQAQARAANDWTQNMGQAQFMSDQSFRNAQFNAQQSQFNAGQMNQYNLGRAQTMAQQGQFGAQFGLEQERAMAQNYAQQRQFNAQFQNSQNQWNAQFGAQQELNQGQLTMQQRAMNDQYQMGMLNQYSNARSMQQQNAWHNQQAELQMAGIKQGLSIAGMQDATARDAAARQQQTAILAGAATMGAGMMTHGYGGAAAGAGSTGTTAPAVANSGFNQSNASKIDWGY